MRYLRERGSTVQLQTVKALLTEVALRRLQLTHYRFCANAACDIVYFGDAGDWFGPTDLRVPVWHKQPDDGRLLCYCFGETESVIRTDCSSTDGPKSSIGSVNTSPRSDARVTFGTPGCVLLG